MGRRGTARRSTGTRCMSSSWRRREWTPVPPQPPGRRQGAQGAEKFEQRALKYVESWPSLPSRVRDLSALVREDLKTQSISCVGNHPLGWNYFTKATARGTEVAVQSKVPSNVAHCAVVGRPSCAKRPHDRRLDRYLPSRRQRRATDSFVDTHRWRRRAWTFSPIHFNSKWPVGRQGKGDVAGLAQKAQRRRLDGSAAGSSQIVGSSEGVGAVDRVCGRSSDGRSWTAPVPSESARSRRPPEPPVVEALIEADVLSAPVRGSSRRARPQRNLAMTAQHPDVLKAPPTSGSSSRRRRRVSRRGSSSIPTFSRRRRTSKRLRDAARGVSAPVDGAPYAGSSRDASRDRNAVSLIKAPRRPQGAGPDSRVAKHGRKGQGARQAAAPSGQARTTGCAACWIKRQNHPQGAAGRRKQLAATVVPAVQGLAEIFGRGEGDLHAIEDALDGVACRFLTAQGPGATSPRRRLITCVSERRGLQRASDWPRPRRGSKADVPTRRRTSKIYAVGRRSETRREHGRVVGPGIRGSLHSFADVPSRDCAPRFKCDFLRRRPEAARDVDSRPRRDSHDGGPGGLRARCSRAALPIRHPRHRAARA